jgi:hypothetical protein
LYQLHLNSLLCTLHTETLYGFAVGDGVG